MDYYHTKLDLESYSTRDLDILTNFYGITADSRQDLLWLLAIANLSGSQHAQMPPAKAWGIYRTQLLERFKSDRTAPEDADVIPKEIVDSDPTQNKKYLDWIIKSYLDGGIKLFEDMPRVNSALQKYLYLLQKRLVTGKYLDIKTFCGITGCIIKGKEKEGLEDLLDRNDDKLIPFHQIKEHQIAEAKADMFYEDSDVSIMIPRTVEASCRLGGGTRWCTAATKGRNLFELYTRDEPLYILIPKNPKYTDEKYQVQSTGATNDKDKEVSILTLQKRFPGIKNIFKVLILSIEDLNNVDRDMTSITFGSDFNEVVDHLPEWLTDITFGFNFNQPVDHLPEGLTHLSFGFEFNQPVDHLPKGLIYLSFGDDFNQPVDNLPEGLTYLKFDWYFNQSINKLPNGLTHLIFRGTKFKHPVPERLAHLLN